jgi:cation:H+ antiporter
MRELEKMLFLFTLALGLTGLWFGATLIVESAKKIAKKLNVSHALIGLTIVSIGTSLPEIATNIKSGMIGASGIAVGTNIGSCLTQITIILGLTALLGTMKATKKLIRRDFPMLLFAIIAMFLVGITGNKIMWFEGLALIIIYLIYLYVLAKDENVGLKVKGEFKEHKNGNGHNGIYSKNLTIMAFGVLILIYTSEMVVSSALDLAEYWGVAQSFVGVMIIGVGTGLPELSTAITGILRKASGVSIGTLIGSNVTDPMFSLGAGAIASGSFLVFENNLLFFDMPFWIIASIIAFFLFSRNMKIGKADKKEGLTLIALYVLFVFLKIKFFL